MGIRNPKDILGKEINFWDEKRGPVVGVVRDFNTYSLQHKISPMFLTLPETDDDKDNLDIPRQYVDAGNVDST